MTDYSTAIIALVAVGLVFTVAVVYVLVQPSDLPSQNKDKSHSLDYRRDWDSYSQKDHF